jgi:hypothetical protein
VKLVWELVDPPKHTRPQLVKQVKRLVREARNNNVCRWCVSAVVVVVVVCVWVGVGGGGSLSSLTVKGMRAKPR